VTATVVETLCCTVIIGYNMNHYYAISTYGDVFACWLQNLVICGLLAWYNRPTRLQMVVGTILFTFFNWWIITGKCGMQALIAMQVRVISACGCSHQFEFHIFTTNRTEVVSTWLMLIPALLSQLACCKDCAAVDATCKCGVAQK
jgi:hypothetical protein